MMEDTISELTNVTQTLISEGISPNVAMQIWPHDTIMQEIQKGDANKRVAITHIMNNQAGTIETYSLIECWKLMVEINPQGA